MKSNQSQAVFTANVTMKRFNKNSTGASVWGIAGASE
jgi:hypothetical protein